MIAEEIRSKTFEHKTMLGYKPEDVTEYLEQVAQSYEQLQKENEDLLTKLKILADKIEEYRKYEGEVHDALIKAQKLANTVINDAKTNADKITSSAYATAESVMAQSKRETENLIQELKDKALKELNDIKNEIKTEKKSLLNAKKETAAFKSELIDLYRRHIELINIIPSAQPAGAQEEASKEIKNDIKEAVQESSDISEEPEEIKEVQIESEQTADEEVISGQEALYDTGVISTEEIDNENNDDINDINQ